MGTGEGGRCEGLSRRQAGAAGRRLRGCLGRPGLLLPPPAAPTLPRFGLPRRRRKGRKRGGVEAWEGSLHLFQRSRKVSRPPSTPLPLWLCAGTAGGPIPTQPSIPVSRPPILAPPQQTVLPLLFSSILPPPPTSLRPATLPRPGLPGTFPSLDGRQQRLRAGGVRSQLPDHDTRAFLYGECCLGFNSRDTVIPYGIAHLVLVLSARVGVHNFRISVLVVTEGSAEAIAIERYTQYGFGYGQAASLPVSMALCA